MANPSIKIGTTSDQIFIGFPDWEKSLDTTYWIIAKILNAIACCFPCLTFGVAEIQLSQKIYYVYRSNLADILQCDAQAPCCNHSELKALALDYFKKNENESNQPEWLFSLDTTGVSSAIQHQVSEIQQGMAKAIADKQKSDVKARKKLNLYKEEQAVKETEQIAQIRATVAHLPLDDKRRLASERFIKNMQESRKSMSANFDEIATACGIAPSDA